MRQLKIGQSITNRKEPSLDKYLQEIGHEDLLTVDDEVELARRVKQGDRRAMDKLIKANLRFVVSVAKQYQNQRLTLSDIIEEGNLGLIKAAQKFDETRGFKFISYAVWWIRQSILQALADQSRIVRLPLNQVGALNKINAALSKFEQENQRKPSSEELAEYLGMEEEQIDGLFQIKGHHVSVDAPFTDEDDNSLLDVMYDSEAPQTDDSSMKNSLSIEIERALHQLPERERKVLKMFFGIGGREMSLEEIGEELNLTRERVRQIKEKGIRHLQGKHSRLLRAYLG